MRLCDEWRDRFMDVVRHDENAERLKDAALKERLTEWTAALTAVTVSTCQAMDWNASAKGHKLELLPVARSEYLALDVMAFPKGEKRWHFPVAVMELENSPQDDKIAYSLWKVLCVRADLRVVFCYRREAEGGSELIRFLRDDVVHPMGVAGRLNLQGETIVAVGTRDASHTFPYGFFKWWGLDLNSGTFRLL